MTKDSELFQALILQLAQAAWASLGKIPNPMTGQVERNLEVARLTIDTIESIETRTAGNLDETERAMIDRTLRDLRLNYLDEQKKPDPADDKKTIDQTETKEPNATPAKNQGNDEENHESTEKPAG